MKSYLSTLATVLILAGLSSACAPNSIQSVKTPAKPLTRRADSTATSTTSTQWHLIENDDFLLRGRILGINNVGQDSYLRLRISGIVPNGPLRIDGRAHTVQRVIDEVLPSGPRPPMTPTFPYPIGSTVTIRFRQSFPADGPLKPRLGETVELWVNHYTIGTTNKSFWGGDMMHSFYYEKHGKFYNADGANPVFLT